MWHSLFLFLHSQLISLKVCQRMLKAAKAYQEENLTVSDISYLGYM